MSEKTGFQFHLTGLSKKHKLAYSIILLIVASFLPGILSTYALIAILLVWFWDKWSKRVKIIVALIPILLFILTFVGFLIPYQFLARPFEVKGDAMYPAYKNNEFVMVNLLNKSVNRGDVVTFKAPPDPEKVFIKRVIGVSNDKIKIKDGAVYLNGKVLNESGYLNPSIKTIGGTFLKENVEIIVPDNKYFILGDNRNYSSDSREWGYVPRDLIIGKVWFCYLNCN